MVELISKMDYDQRNGGHCDRLIFLLWILLLRIILFNFFFSLILFGTHFYDYRPKEPYSLPINDHSFLHSTLHQIHCIISQCTPHVRKFIFIIFRWFWTVELCEEFNPKKVKYHCLACLVEAEIPLIVGTVCDGDQNIWW